MDITEMLNNLVLDLKVTLDTEISTEEGKRAIDKAVDELSRHIPRERIYDCTWVKAVIDDSFTTPAVASDTSIVSAFDLPVAIAGSNATLVTSWNDVPRPVKITLTDPTNLITRMTIIVKGTDADGVYREERFYRHGGKVQTGKILFYSFLAVEIYDIDGNVTGLTLSVGTNSPDLATGGVWIQLDNPIEPGTESVYSAALKTGTKYTLNTDYEMDYANGRIRMKNGGSLAVSTTYYVNYSRASTSIDISSVVPELIRIIKVLYPADKVPEQQVAFSIWENMLTIGSLRQGVSQETLTDEKHIAIYYEAKHAPPTLVGSGSYPELLDEIVLVGAAGQALLMESLQYEQAAVTDLASMRTELGLTTAVHTLIATALGKVTTYVTDMDTALDAAIVQADAAATALTKINNDSGRTYITDADTALDASIVQSAASATALAEMAVHITDADIALDESVTQVALAATALAKINAAGTPHLTDADTALDAGVVQLAAASTALAKISSETYLTDADGALDEAATALVNVTKYLNNNSAVDAAGMLANILTNIAELRTKIITATGAMASSLVLVSGATGDLDIATVGARAWLLEGELLINRLNDGGPDVANKFANYARAKIEISQARIQQALGYGQEATMRLSDLRAWIEQANAHTVIAQTFASEARERINEAAARLAIADRYINEAVGRDNSASGYIAEAAQRLAIADRWIAEANGRDNSANMYIAEASTRLQVANVYVAESSERNRASSMYIAEAQARLQIADRYISESVERNNSASVYINEAMGRFNMTQAFLGEANARISQIDRYLAEATRYQEASGINLVLADRFRAEAQSRLNEFRTVLASKSEYRKKVVSVSVRQPN